MEYARGDKVFLKKEDCLGKMSGKKAEIIRKLRPDEIDIEDHAFGSTCVYEVWIPMHGNIYILNGLIEGAI